MKIADLYCCQGGAAKGLQEAFPAAEITGFDVKPQPRYPFRFVQQDALTVDLSAFDFVWASPPCQAFSVMFDVRRLHVHPELIEPTRAMLVASGKPWIMENVPGAPMVNYVTLCGSMFGLASHSRRYLKRHRLFETSWTVTSLLPPHNHCGQAVSIVGHGSAGHLGMRIRTANAAEAKQLLGVDWMTRDGMSQAIPPAYARWLAEDFQLTSHYGGLLK